MSGSKINVNRNVQDPFYRYKMPKIVVKVEGKGNGIKTVIANMSEIAKALSRPPTYPTKYFGCELGAQTNFDGKNDRYIVNGEHDANKLQDILDVFIKKFVLCPECENPETTLTVKRQAIHGKCKACGKSFIVDPKQKLSTFILKNPPTTDADVENKEQNESPTGDEGDANKVGSPLNTTLCESFAGEEIDDWEPEPVDNQEKLTGPLSKLVIDKDLDKSVDERVDMLHQFFKNSLEDGSIQDSKKMLNEAERLELKTKAPLLLVEILFDNDVIKEIKQYRMLLLRFCNNDKKAQRYLLGGIEQLIHERRDVLLQKSAHIMKALYDEDICCEDVILSWGEKPSGKYIKKEFAKEIVKIAQPVLNWLKEADEDSETDDDEDDVAFETRDTNGIEKSVDTKKEGPKYDNEDESDIDIDNI